MSVQTLKKKSNESEQVEVDSVSEDHQNLPRNVMNPPNSSDPGLVEKLMQQLNDLKELVCI